MPLLGCNPISVLYKFKVCNLHAVSTVRFMSVVTKVLNGTKIDTVGLSPNMTLTALQCRETGMNVTIANVCSVGFFDWASLWVSATRMPSADMNCTAFNRLNVTFGSSQGSVKSPTIPPRSAQPTASKIVSSTMSPVSMCQITVRRGRLLVLALPLCH